MTNSIIPEKQDGVNAFAADNYHLAVDLLAKAWQKQHDPETLIYLNNARIEVQNVKAYTIAVVAPIGDNNNDSINSSKVILQGVAQAQDEFNKKYKEKKIGLKVLIASDKNNPLDANNIAKYMVDKSDVLAVIGHFRSDTTLAAMDVYQQHHLLLISPTATSVDLSTVCKPDHPNCFFRVVDSNRVTALALASYLKKSKKGRAAIFFNPNSNYSRSLQKEMKDIFSELGGKVVAIPFSDNLETMINQVEENKADVIVLFPTTDGLTSDSAVQVIGYAKQFKYLIVGGDSLDTPKIISTITENEPGLVMAIPWDSKSTPNQDFPSQAEKLWGKTVYWHTALAYDATRVLLAALEKLSSPSRVDLQQAMADPNFKAQGATGEISFKKNGDRKEPIIYLVKVVRNSHTGKLEFLP